MKKGIFYLLITILSLSSCTEGNDKVIALSKAFFTTLSDSTYACPRDYYPLYDSLDVKAKSDFVEIEERDIVKNGDSWHVRCYNSYTSSKGVFKQDSVTLYIKTNSADQLYIYDSKGLVTIDDDIKDYGKSVGAFTNQSFCDVELANRIKHVTKMLVKEYFNVHFDLTLNVRIKDWSWETSYSGEAHGEGCVVNELDYIVDGIKYELTYYDWKGDFMAKDDGNISKKLYPGEKYDFTFWSSNAKNPKKANMRLSFPDKLVFDIIKKKPYTGQEYQEYLEALNSKDDEEEAESDDDVKDV